MWYECLPSLFIITACVSLPIYIQPVLTKLMTGHRASRTFRTNFERVTVGRDVHLTGHRNVYYGLENIPDK